MLKRISALKTDKCGIIYAVLMAFTFVLSMIVRPIAWNKEPYKQIRLSVFTIKNALIFLGCTILFLVLWEMLFYLWNKVSFCKGNVGQNVFRKTIIIVLLFWSIAWLVHFPGTGMNDTVNIINNAVNASSLQPLLYSLIVNAIMHKVESLTGSMLIGYAAFVLVQMIVLAWIVAYTAEWLSTKGVRKEVIEAYSIFFAVTPIVANYAVVVVKDNIYSYATLLILPCIIDLINTKGEWIKDRKNAVLFTIILIAVAFMRNNGKLIAFIVVIWCIVKYKECRSIFVKNLILLIVMSELLSTVGRNALSEDISFREAVSVPMIQMAAVVSNEGKIYEEQIKTIERFAPINVWRDHYSFSNVDVIKFNGEFHNQYLNENKGEFFKLWFELGVQNPALYVRAYLFHMYGFWNLNSSDLWAWFGGQSIFFTTCNNTSGAWWNEYTAEHGFENRGILNLEQMEVFKEKYRYIFFFFGGGQMFWGLLLLLSFCIQTRSKNLAVFGVLLLNWVSMMVAAPISYAYRYVFYLVVTLPFVLVYFKLVRERQIMKDVKEKEGKNG